MSRRASGVAVVVLAAFGAAALVVARGADEGGHAPAPAPTELEAIAGVAPRVALFGDTIEATLDVIVDPERVDPGSVRVAVEFSPWGPVAAPRRTRRDGETTTHVRIAFVLRCLISPCVPPRQTASLEFMPARVTYALRGGGTRTTTARWPVLVTHTRIVPDDFDEPDEIAIPWRMDVVTLPAVSYRVAPSILLAALLGAAALLALAGGAFLYRALPRRAPVQPVRVEERPEPPLTPLERALALLEDAERADGSADRRRALRLVADALHERDAELARAARALAWSVETPEVGATSGLAGRMRDVLARDREAEDA